MSIAAFIVALLALALAAWSAVSSHRASKHAMRSAAAAEESVHIAHRTETRELDNAQSIDWDLARGTGESFVLTNLGPGTALGVRVTGPVTVREQGPDVVKGGSLLLRDNSDLSVRDNTIAVTWTTESGEPHSTTMALA